MIDMLIVEDVATKVESTLWGLGYHSHRRQPEIERYHPINPITVEFM
jgi:hypothetical protein